MKKMLLILAGLFFIGGCGGTDKPDWYVKVHGEDSRPIAVKVPQKLLVEVKAQDGVTLPVEMKINKEVIVIAVVLGAMTGFAFLTAVFNWRATRHIRRAIERKRDER